MEASYNSQPAPESPEEEDEGGGITRMLPGYAVVLAFILVAAYIVGLVGQWLEAGTLEEVTWARRDQLFVGLEALVFAAVGAVFGVQVQRAAGRVETRAAKHEQRAETAAKLKTTDVQLRRTVDDYLADLRTTARKEGEEPKAEILDKLDDLSNQLRQGRSEFDQKVEEAFTGSIV
jgi:type VI protein secretion system component VasK